MNNYVIGTRVTLSADFKDLAGTLVDPTTVTAKVMQPDGVVATLTATKVSVGKYEADFMPSQEGLHTYRFEGTGTCIAAEEQNFTTRTSF